MAEKKAHVLKAFRVTASSIPRPEPIINQNFRKTKLEKYDKLKYRRRSTVSISTWQRSTSSLNALSSQKCS